MENKKTLLLFKMKYLDKLLESDFAKRLEKNGLTPQQGRILMHVCKYHKNNEALNQNDLTEKLHLTKSTVSGLVKRLIEKELIKVVKDKNNHILKPTENGLNLQDHFIKEGEKTFQKVLGDISEETAELMIKQIDTFIDKLQKEDNHNDDTH